MLLLHILLCLISRDTSNFSAYAAAIHPQESTLAFRTRDSAINDPAHSNQRSILDIVWSCLMTIFLCTWVAVHPDIPEDDQSDREILLHRLKMMCWTIIFPELVIAHAIRQLGAARDLLREYKKTDGGWTMKHAHFERMGGFRKVGGHLTSSQIPVAEIQDKSKADGLSKIILVTQTLWFVVQCIGRLANGLELSPLEVTTLALTVCTFMLSIIWWNKPFDVRKPTRLECALRHVPSAHSSISHIMKTERSLDTVPLEEDITAGGFLYNIYPDDDVSGSPSHSLPEYGLGWGRPRLENSIPIGKRGIVRNNPRNPSPNIYKSVLVAVTHLKSFTNWVFGYAAMVVRIFIARAATKPFKSLANLKVPGFKYIKRILTALSLLLTKTTTLFRIASGFNSLLFEDGIDTSASFSALLQRFGIPVIGAMIFGSVHCIAWNSYFPTTPERTLWRISSVAVSALMLIIACAYRLAFSSGRYSVYPARIIGLSAVFYVIARCYLLVEGIIAFRDLPSSALETLNWSDFLPHIS